MNIKTGLVVRATAALAIVGAGLTIGSGVASAHHADLSATANCQESSGLWSVEATLTYPNESWSEGQTFSGSATVSGATIISAQALAPGASASGSLGP